MDTTDEALLSGVREHVDVIRSNKYASCVRTTASGRALEQLYELRNMNTHRNSLPIMSAGTSLPQDFHLGWEIGKGMPLLDLCEGVMAEIGQLRFKKEACMAGAWPPPPQIDPPDEA